VFPIDYLQLAKLDCFSLCQFCLIKAKTSSLFRLNLTVPDVMEMNNAAAAAAAAAMQDSDSASDCSHFSIITPPSPPPPVVSSCSRCGSQEKAQENDSDVAPVANGHERTKDKRRLPTKSTRLESEPSEPFTHSLTGKSDYWASKLADVEAALEHFQVAAAFKSAHENDSTSKDDLQAGYPDPKAELQMATLLKAQYQRLWEGVASTLHQAMFEDELSHRAGPQETLPLPLVDRQWCLDIVKNAFITAIVEDATCGAASMLATPTLASDGNGITGLRPSGQKKKKKRKGLKDWQTERRQPEPYIDPMSQLHPEAYDMLPMEQYQGPTDPYARPQPMQYPPLPDPVYGMHPMGQYPSPPPDPFARMQQPPSPPLPPSPPPLPPLNQEAYGLPPQHQYPPPSPFTQRNPIPSPPPPPDPEAYENVEQYHPDVSFTQRQPVPCRRRRHSADLLSSASSYLLDRDDEEKPKGRVNKTEVRWWLRTALNLSEVLCMLVIVIAVFRTPGLLGELLDVMHPKNKDRCLGFRVRR
jgi:hypothetical protein